MLTGHQGIIANTKTRVRCVFCGVFIPNANRCIEEHHGGARHRESIGVACENGISYAIGQGLYCKLCKRILPHDEPMLQHLETEDHSNWITMLKGLTKGEYLHFEAFLASQTDDAYCGTCNVPVLCTLQRLEEHVNQNYHIIETARPTNALFNVDDPNELWCKVCDTYIEYSPAGVLDHIEEDEFHINWFNRMEQFMSNNQIVITNYLAHEFENKVYCLRCQSEIHCNFKSIEYHIQTEPHISTEYPVVREEQDQSD